MSDLISRQAAIDTAIEAADKWDGGYSSEREGIIRKFFDKVPAAQPTCKPECKPMYADVSDTISRQWLMECVSEGWIKFDTEKDENKFMHLVRDIAPSAQPATNCSEIPNGSDDTISRQAAIDALKEVFNPSITNFVKASIAIDKLPIAQPERDIPIKPNETTDTAWGIPLRQAVCPKCDYYLGHVAFLGDYKGKKVTYCETCGQAIDWEGWDLNEQTD